MTTSDEAAGKSSWWGFIERAEDFWRCSEFCLMQEKHVGAEHFVPLWGPGVMLHLSVELYMKGYLVAMGATESDLRRNYVHDLNKLYKAVLVHSPGLAGLENEVSRLNRFGDRRAGAIYPGPHDQAGWSDDLLHERLGPFVQALRTYCWAIGRVPASGVTRRVGLCE